MARLTPLTAAATLFFVFASAGGNDANASTGLVTAWTQLGPDGAVIARAITADATCPDAILDENTTTMQVRAGPAKGFPNTVCELTIKPDTESLRVGDFELPLLAEDPKKVVVIGDTGCKVEQDEIQDCSDPAAWPFQTIAQQAAAIEPDLIVHVGDIVYREAPCPAGDGRCPGSPVGSTWASNNADFFTPVGNALQSAPWLFSRGNHENCQSAENGAGWFRYYDPYPYPAACSDYTPMFSLPLGNRQIVVIDASARNTGEVDPTVVAQYRPEFAALPDLVGNTPTWFVTHAPMWAFIAFNKGGKQIQVVNTVNLQEASGNSLPKGIEVVLSGGTHGAQFLEFADGRPPQVVSGNSGDLLDPPLKQPLAGTPIAGTTIKSGFSAAVFGYSVLERSDDRWTITFFGVGGNVLYNGSI